MVDPPSVEETIQILNNIKSKYEDYHNVTYSDDAIDACVKLSDRYMTDRLLPDKAIDVLDEVGARVHLKNINVPQNIVDLEKKIEDVKNEKNKVVKSQKFEEAASASGTPRSACRKSWKRRRRNGKKKASINAIRSTRKILQRWSA